MLFSTLFLATLLGGFSSAAATPSKRLPKGPAPLASMPDVPLQLEYLFTAELGLGTPSKPINLTGGVLEDEPIVNGTVSGPALNATVKAGLAYPQVIENGNVQIAQIVAYGTTRGRCRRSPCSSHQDRKSTQTWIYMLVDE